MELIDAMNGEAPHATREAWDSSAVAAACDGGLRSNVGLNGRYSVVFATTGFAGYNTELDPRNDEPDEDTDAVDCPACVELMRVARNDRNEGRAAHCQELF